MYADEHEITLFESLEKDITARKKREIVYGFLLSHLGSAATIGAGVIAAVEFSSEEPFRGLYAASVAGAVGLLTGAAAHSTYEKCVELGQITAGQQ